MKKTPAPNREERSDDELLVEYQFNYRLAKPNRFVLKEQQLLVVLAPDVAEHFKDSESVNRVLRALIANMPRAA